VEKKPVTRPTIISVIGIVNIVFGSMGLITAVCCIGGGMLITPLLSQMPLPQGPGKAPIENPMSKLNAVPGYLAFQVAQVAMGVFTGSLLLISGIGFLKMKRWSRSLTFVYVVVAIVWAVIAMVVQQRVVTPAMKEFGQKVQESTGQPNPVLDNPVFMTIGYAIGMLASFALPVVLFVLMLLPAVRLGLAGKVDPAWQPDEGKFEGDVDPDNTVKL
jgi:hypothetical protein